MSGYCMGCGNTICICNLPDHCEDCECPPCYERRHYVGSAEDNSENIARLKRIKEATGGVNALALSDGDLLFLIESLEKEWE